MRIPIYSLTKEKTKHSDKQVCLRELEHTVTWVLGVMSLKLLKFRWRKESNHNFSPKVLSI